MGRSVTEWITSFQLGFKPMSGYIKAILLSEVKLTENGEEQIMAMGASFQRLYN